VRALATVVLAAALLGTLASSATAGVRVSVQACPTTYGIPGDHPKRPTHATLALTTREAGSLLAWAGGGTPVVLAPRGFACRAFVGADGSVQVRLAPPDAAASGPAVEVEVEGSCVGCIASLACGLFPRAAKDTGFPCHTVRPKRERVATLLPNVRAFIDPAGVKGSGNPSGGPLRAVGAIVYVPNRSTFAARLTCTLAGSDAASCQGILTDFLGRVGHS
jgi:hypothetical protein